MIFTWIFIAVVAGLIFFFGFKMIKNISDTGEDVRIVKFWQNFEKKSNEFYYLDSGSQGNETFYLPGRVQSVCLRKDSDGANKFSDVSDVKTKELLNNLNTFNVFLNPIIDSNLDIKLVDNLNQDVSKCFNVNNGVLELGLVNEDGDVKVA